MRAEQRPAPSLATAMLPAGAMPPAMAAPPASAALPVTAAPPVTAASPLLGLPVTGPPAMAARPVTAALRATAALPVTAALPLMGLPVTRQPAMTVLPATATAALPAAAAHRGGATRPVASAVATSKLAASTVAASSMAASAVAASVVAASAAIAGWLAEGSGWLAAGGGRSATGITQSAGGARRLGVGGRQSAGGARRFAGFPAVGTLFTVAGGQLVHHFCTGSVVDSPAGNLVITAAHCVGRLSPGQVAFVPGYRDGAEPYGAWAISAIYTDARWRASASPNHDVAFLVVRPDASGREIQQVTGGQRLGTGWRARVTVHVAGYPDQTDSPIICRRRTQGFGRRQLKVVCGGFTGGTSGGPFLARLNTVTGEGTVIGVIGGYEQGGDLAWVSYSPRFGRAVRALYQAASAGQPATASPLSPSRHP